MGTDRGGARLPAIVLALVLGGCSDEPQDALGPDPSVPAAPIVSDPASFGDGASFRLAGAGFVYVSLPPGTAPGGTSAAISNASIGTSLTLALVEGGLDPVAVPASAGDTISLAIQGGVSPASFALVVPTGLRPSVVRTHPRAAAISRCFRSCGSCSPSRWTR